MSANSRSLSAARSEHGREARAAQPRKLRARLVVEQRIGRRPSREEALDEAADQDHAEPETAQLLGRDDGDAGATETPELLRPVREDVPRDGRERLDARPGLDVSQP